MVESERGDARGIISVSKAHDDGVSGDRSHLGGHFGITHLDQGALQSLIDRFAIQSMIDVGCGPGGMVALAHRLGIDALGIDGDGLMFKRWPKLRSRFVLHDFSRAPLRGLPSCDLAWSCEFLEHVEERYQAHYMPAFETARIVVCTAAPPGMKGHHHVNCQPSHYWTDVFERHGFEFDEAETERVRKASTMKRDFIRVRGLCFRANA